MCPFLIAKNECCFFKGYVIFLRYEFVNFPKLLKNIFYNLNLYDSLTVYFKSY